MRSSRMAALGALLLAALVGFFVLGDLLIRTSIGLDSTSFPGGAAIQALASRLELMPGRSAAGPFWLLVVALAVLVGSFLWVRGRIRAGVAATDPGRRSFLTGALGGGAAALGAGAAAGAATVARGIYGLGNQGRGWGPVLDGIVQADVVKTHPEYPERWKGARVAAHRRLGRTGFQVSDVVVGCGQLKGDKGTEILREAMARGINYVDTSPDYSDASSEQAVGRALSGRRADVFLATKFCTPRGHLGPGTSVADYMGAVEASLKRLRTDYVDLVHIHSCDELDRLMDPQAHEAFDRLREQGKARFLGFSTHTPNLVEVAERGIESGRFDVMMLAYHHGIWPEIGRVIERARSEQDMGVVAMKTLKGAKHHGLAGFQEHAETYSQAALSWALSNKQVSCAVISFFEHQHVDEYLQASGRSLSARDVAQLQEYDRQTAGTQCLPHCGACLQHCPEGLPIHDVLRYRMYFEDYGWEKEGLRLYSQLETNAAQCAGCSAPCLGSCPVGISIQERMEGAHDLLTLS